jgi:hypothetical protein
MKHNARWYASKTQPGAIPANREQCGVISPRVVLTLTGRAYIDRIAKGAHW